MNQLIIITLIGIGGGLGAILRHLSSVAIVRIWPHAFPMATFCINLLGALLIGVLMAILTAKEAQSSLLKYFFITGLCGGYTTFSTFSLENWQLIEAGKFGTALLYSMSSLILSLGCVFTGLYVGKSLS